MPIYSYRCTECGEAFDIRQEFTDDSLTECPNCGGKLRKLFNTVGVSFNGPGFYRTDSRPGEKSGESKSTESKPAATETKSESKPAPASTPAAPASKD
jgi:putative FmdB family regulatory protein